MTNYELDTKLAYRDQDRAQQYRNYYSRGISWIRLTMNLERAIVSRWLSERNYTDDSLALDAPCGTGLMAKALRTIPGRVVASDIALEMMQLAESEYPPSRFAGFLQSDVMRLPFAGATFDCVLCVGLLHRLPAELRNLAIIELCRVCSRDILVSFSVDTALQRAKRRVLRRVPLSYGAAPSPSVRRDILDIFEAQNFRLVRERRTVPILSSDTLMLFARIC